MLVLAYRLLTLRFVCGYSDVVIGYVITATDCIGLQLTGTFTYG
jgi:hypothetical protein